MGTLALFIVSENVTLSGQVFSLDQLAYGWTEQAHSNHLKGFKCSLKKRTQSIDLAIYYFLTPVFLLVC